MPDDDFRLPEPPGPYIPYQPPRKTSGVGCAVAYGIFVTWLFLASLIANGWSFNFMVIMVLMVFVGTPLLGAGLFVAMRDR